MDKFLCFVAATLFLISCQSSETNVAKAENALVENDTVVSKVQEELKLLSYWKDFDFNNIELVKSPQIGERKFVDFLDALSSVSDSVAIEAIRAHLRLAEVNKDGFDYYIGQYEHYLYDPNSSTRNELYYQPVLEYLINSPATDNAQRIRHQMILKLVSQNNTGEKANDFSFIDTKNQSRTLENEASEYKILFFYDPTCTTCAGKITDLGNSKAANDLITVGKLKILAISLHPDRKLWVDDQSSIPTNWLNGFDNKGQVIGKGLYNILAYPTIYLLDRENKVLTKDAPLDVTLRTLFKLASEN
mgnify:CR=1 FL=1